jgi:hypothetical protein
LGEEDGVGELLRDGKGAGEGAGEVISVKVLVGGW